MATERIDRLKQLLDERIVVLDGSWGVLLQGRGITEDEWRGERFADHSHDVKGNPDLLNLTKPDLVSEIHRAYFEAGADIATTNTFTATSIGQADYALESAVAEMNHAGARLAREAADEFDGFVAGSIGPLNVSLSISPKVDDPGYRSATFDQVRDAYAEQIRALAEGGVDILMIETVFDTLNAKAAVVAAQETAPELPLWLSFTAIDLSGRNLSGQTVEAFWLSVEHAKPLIVGVNCSLGAAQMRPFVHDLAEIAPTYVACHPNAGLPNEMGAHDEQPADTSRFLGDFARDGLVNIVGGCCGTRPEHIRAIADMTRGLAPRQVAKRPSQPRFSGLEPFEIGPDTGFVMVGERTNVTGSARFRKLVEADDYTGAVEVALEQVRGGANFLDVNMDADLLESEQAMTTFLNVIATEPEVARIPIMVDSSRPSVLEAGLKCVQGKGVVNSISLKEGEEAFVEQARLVRRYGAGVIVMAFDEQGQADTVQAQGRDLRTRVRPADAEGRLRARGHRLRPERARRRDRNRGAQRVREGLHREPAADQGALPRGAHERRHLQPLFRLPRQRRRPRGDALRLPLPRHQGRPRHGHRQRGPARGVRGHPARPARARRGRALQPARRRDRAPRGVREHGPGRGHEARARPLVARSARREAARVRARARRRGLHRGRRRGGAAQASAAPRRDRGPAHAGHAGRRRPLRLGPDVPPAGGEERPRDEARRRLPGAVHGGREGAERRRSREGQGRPCDRQRRRPRHRQEHRRSRARLQQLRGRRPRRDGAGREDPRHGCRGGSRCRRALGLDHAVPGRDGRRRRRDGAPRARPAAPHRRCDHVEAAHRCEDRPCVLRFGRARPGRLSGGRGRRRPPRRHSARAPRYREPRAPGAPARTARREDAQAAPATPGGARERRARLVRGAPRAAVHGRRGCWSPTWRRCAATSTGSSSSTPGS